MTRPATALARAMTEDQLVEATIGLALTFGWHADHRRPGRTNKGPRTCLQGLPGFPDLTLARAGRVIFAECKSQRGALEPDQAGWRDALTADGHDAAAVEWYLWRPSDWLDGTIEAVLCGRRYAWQEGFRR